MLAAASLEIGDKSSRDNRHFIGHYPANFQLETFRQWYARAGWYRLTKADVKFCKPFESRAKLLCLAGSISNGADRSSS